MNFTIVESIHLNNNPLTIQNGMLYIKCNIQIEPNTFIALNGLEDDDDIQMQPLKILSYANSAIVVAINNRNDNINNFGGKYVLLYKIRDIKLQQSSHNYILDTPLNHINSIKIIYSSFPNINENIMIKCKNFNVVNNLNSAIIPNYFNMLLASNTNINRHLDIIAEVNITNLTSFIFNFYDMNGNEIKFDSDYEMILEIKI